MTVRGPKGIAGSAAFGVPPGTKKVTSVESEPVRPSTPVGLVPPLATQRAAERSVESDFTAPTLNFSVTEGPNLNQFLQSAEVACQLVVSSSPRARAIAAFPSGNSGVALFAPKDAPGFTWEVGPLRHVPTAPESQRVGFVLAAAGPSVVLDPPVLDSLRSVREVTEGVGKPLAFEAEQQRLQSPPRIEANADGTRVVFQRANLDGSKYELVLQVPAGTQVRFDSENRLHLLADGLKPLAVAVEAEVPFAPSKPFAVEEFIKPEALARLSQFDPLDGRTQQMVKALKSLRFLAYQQATDAEGKAIPFSEKFLAGGWRFLTYFGRDTLLSTSMLQDLLTPKALQTALASVIDRLSPEGRVAHEEDVGTFAEFRALKEGAELQTASQREPIFDYKMVDDDFMLPLLVQAYSRSAASDELSAFLDSKSPSGLSRRDGLLKNFDYVLSGAAAYDGRPQTLVKIDDPYVGDWRDSEAGLGAGVYPASINVDLVFNALSALESLSTKLGADEPARKAEQLRQKWAGANEHFDIRLAPDVLRQRLSTFLSLPSTQSQQERLLGVELGNNESGAPVTLKQFIEGQTPTSLKDGLSFDALSLDAEGRPIPVMHSDAALRLFLGNPSPEAIARILPILELPYPVGLSTPGGVLTANPAYANDFVFTGLDQAREKLETTRLTEKLDRRGYHGTVVWLWPHAMMQLGLIRQIERLSKTPGLRDSPEVQQLTQRMYEVLLTLRSATERMGELANAELITIDDQGLPTSFGQAMGSPTESNGAQLWSTVLPAVELAFIRLQEQRVHEFAS